MRRKDKETTSSVVLNEIMDRVLVGHLAIIRENGFPRSAPMNFAWLENTIYFHGARAGEKFELLKESTTVGFTIAQELSLIPSTWLGPQACGANHLFRSVSIAGKGSLVSDPGEKNSALSALMKKYEPDGGYREITTSDEHYSREIEKTAIFKIVPEEITIKTNLLQGDPVELKLSLIKRLKERGDALDLLTIEEIHKTLPETFK